MNNYETVFIMNPVLSEEQIKETVKKFVSFIKTNQGTVSHEENWGLRDLSYSINKFKKAFYRFFQIETTGGIIKEINQELNQSENLIRYIFIKVKDHQELPTKLNNEKKEI